MTGRAGTITVYKSWLIEEALKQVFDDDFGSPRPTSESEEDMMQLSIRPSKKKRVHVLLAFGAIYLIWGTTYLAIRIAVETIPPFLMAGTRFIVAGLLALAFLRMRGVKFPSRRELRSAAIAGTFLLVGGNGLVTWSEQQIPSGIAALLVATVPLWVTLLGWLFLKGGRPSGLTSLGIILGFLGIGVLIGPGQLSGTNALHLPSLMLLVAAPILWSIGTLYSTRAALPDNVFMATAVEMLLGGVLLLLAGLVTGEHASLDLQGISGASILATLYLTLFGSIVALTAYVWLLQSVDPAVVATYTYVNPLIAISLGWLLLGETLSLHAMIAVAVILASVVMISFSRRGTRTPEQAVERLETPICPAPAAGD